MSFYSVRPVQLNNHVMFMEENKNFEVEVTYMNGGHYNYRKSVYYAVYAVAVDVYKKTLPTLRERGGQFLVTLRIKLKDGLWYLDKVDRL